jgi:hypothetical protein
MNESVNAEKVCRDCENSVDPTRLVKNPNVVLCEECLAKRVITAKVEMSLPLVRQQM